MTLHVKKYKPKPVLEDQVWAVKLTKENYEEARTWAGGLDDDLEGMWLVRMDVDEWNVFDDKDFEEFWEAC